MEKIIREYQDRLNDLSRRNRAVRLSRIVQRKSFDLFDLETISEGHSLKVLNTLFDTNKPIELVKTNSTDKDVERILKNITYLKREMDFILKDKGFFECYLGYPFVEGNFHDGTYFRAPLFLIPIEIINNREKNIIEVKALTDSEVSVNKTFFLAFNKYNRNKSEIDISKFDELDGLEPSKRIEWIEGIFATANVHLEKTNFEFKEKIDKFENLRKDEFPQIDPKKIILKNIAVLGEFKQLSSTINNDYENILSNKLSNDIVEEIWGNPVERELEERYDYEKNIDYPERDNYFITMPDISQERVLVRAKKNKGLVIHGPPGTGKSQVITNMIADNLLNQKKTLLVCEKKAALDVVNNRLATKGLGKNCVLVHDSVTDRNEIFTGMLNILEKLDENENQEKFEELMSELDSKNNLIENKLVDLKKYVDLMHEKQNFGTTLYNLYRLSSVEEKNINLEKFEVVKNIKFKQLDELSTKLSSFVDEYKDFESENSPFFKRKRLSESTGEHKLIELFSKGVDLFTEFEKTFYVPNFVEDIKKIKNKNGFESGDILVLYEKFEEYNKLKNSKLKLFNPKWWAEKKLFEEFNESLDETLGRWKSVDGLLQKIDAYLKEMSIHFKEEKLDEIVDNIINQQTNKLFFKELIKQKNKIEDIINFDIHYSKLPIDEKEILANGISQLNKNVTKKEFEKCIKNSFYLYWINQIEKENYWIKEFSNQKYSEIVKEIDKVIKQKIELIPQLINARLQKTYSKIKWQGYDGDGRRKNYNTLRQLMHELGKKRRRLTIRELTNQFESEGIFELFSCWMCSPEIASSIFKMKKNLFDVVIFDEASQCRLEKAIPSIIRGKKLIVAGDEKQLPPTTFFKSFGNDDEDHEEYDFEEKQLLEDESLLVRAKTVLDGERLLYHYRSNYEELINFSNQMFYNSSLKVIPKNEQPKEPAIQFKNVKGTWENRQNIKEAQYVVSLIKQFLKDKKNNPTIGVITFNFVQKNLIQDMLEEEARKDSTFGNLLDKELERYNKEEFVGLFIKNIENVQGDERDIIIFSISYGFDNSNKFRYHFGPINGEYGPNRLNVAISRAKEKIYVVSSFEPTDLKYEGKFEGPKLLRKYLEYCKLISEGKKEDAYSKLVPEDNNEITVEEYDQYDSDFEGEVRDELVKLGYKVKTQVGCRGYKIDLAIQHPKKKNNFILGIECDGAAYHSSKSAKDRDIYRQSILEQAGWKITRIWSRDWWRSPEKEIQRLDREIKWELKRN